MKIIQTVILLILAAYAGIIKADTVAINPDSLASKLNFPADNHEKAFNTLKEKIFHYFDNNIKQAGKLLPYLKYYSLKLEKPVYTGTYYKIYSYYQAYASHEDSAIFYLKKAISIFEKDSENNTNYLITCYNGLSLIYDEIGMYEQAIDNNLKAISIAESVLEDSSDNQGGRIRYFLASMYNDMAIIYSNAEDTIHAEEYFKKSIGYAAEYDIKNVEINNKLNYAIWLSGIKRYKEAIENFNEAKDVITKDTNTLLAIMFYEAEIYYKYYHKTKEPISILYKAIKIAEQKGYSNSLNKTYIFLAQIYKETGNLDSALYLNLKVLSNPNLLNNPNRRKNVYFNLAEIYKSKKLYEKSCKYQSKYIKISDSINTAETIEKINTVKLKYNLEKQKSKNKLLLVNNQIKDAKIQQQRTRNSLLVAFLIIFIIFFAMLFLFYKNMKRKNEDLNILNRKLKKSKKELEELYETQKNLFALISHDLKGPIGTTKSLLDILNDNSYEISKEEKEKYIEIISRTINSTYDLLENILFWARSRMQNKKPALVLFSPYEVAKNIIDNIDQTFFTKEIEINNLIDSKLEIYSCKEIFRTVMRNLISNAIKFTPRKGKIDIRAEEENDRYVFYVKDTGIGMDEEQAASLFNNQIKQSTPGTEKEKGSGLGLLISSELIRSLGGEIGVKSQKGKGSTFYFSLKKQ